MSSFCLPFSKQTSSPGRNYEKLAKTADLANSTASEDDKIKAMMSQSSQEYDPSKYVKSRSMTGPLPPNYTCFRCGKTGHWIKNCPTNNVEVKRSTGIPRSFMVTVDGPDHKGALLTSTGEFAVPLIDHQAYKEVKKEKPPFVREATPEPVQEPQLPDELLCMICHDLLQDAVLIPCCGNSFCDECVRQELLDSEQHECPVCHETDISPNNLIPNRFLRTAVLNFKNETGYTRIRRGQLAPASAAAASASAASTCAASSPRATVGDEGSATPPPATQQPDEQEPDKPVDKPADKPAASPVKKSPASGTEEETPIEKVDGGAKLEVAGAASLDDTSRSPAVGTPGENPPGTPLADENPEEPAGPKPGRGFDHVAPTPLPRRELAAARAPDGEWQPFVSWQRRGECVCHSHHHDARSVVHWADRDARAFKQGPSHGPPSQGTIWARSFAGCCGRLTPVTVAMKRDGGDNAHKHSRNTGSHNTKNQGTR
ncbi:hypothetical protein MRX96_005940 [Rhipicephalus microplus]